MWWSLLACTASAPVEPAPDCSSLPPGPRPGRRLEVAATEDLDFDRFGHLVGSDFSSLVWSTREGQVDVRVPGLQAPAGIRLLGDDVLVADVTEGALLRLRPDGAREVLHGGLNWPNGLALTPDGAVLVTELSGARVWRVEPDTGAAEVLAEVERPNGIAVTPDGDAAIVGTMTGAGALWRVPLDGGELERIAEGLGAGDLDGVAVDVCGNAYVADVEGGTVLRVSPDGREVEVLAEVSEEGQLWPGLQWGSGVGGWRADRLYLAEPATVSVHELDVDVPGVRW